MKKKYKAFTLVEMLIVMGIIVILMAIGIGVGRYAIRKSQEVYHKDAVRNLYSALIKYKSDNKQYPRIGSCVNCIEEEFFAYALGFKGTQDENVLVQYLEEEGEFDGGADATFYYGVDEVDAQSVIICVSYGGIDDQSEMGFYCTGDGIGYLPEGNPINTEEIGSQESGDRYASIVKSLDDSDWYNNGGFAASGK